MTELQAELMAHQQEGVEFLLARRSGLLAFEQGLGKTLVAISAFVTLRDRGEIAAMVVVCPNSLKGNWRAEIVRFAPSLKVHVFGGEPRRRRREMWEAKADVYLVNYEAARNEITTIRALLSRAPSVLVFDESHWVKNWRSLNSVASRHLAPLTAYRWLLTGTPVTNSPEDLYSQLALVADPDPLGSHAAFMAHFGEATTNSKVRTTLAERIAPFLLRRTKEQCLDLPEKTFVDIRITLPAWQRTMYEDMRDRFVCEVEGMDREQFRCFAPTALARLLRLSQLASNPRLIFPEETREPGKLIELDRIVDDLVIRGGRKAIIWSHYVRTIEGLLTHFATVGAEAIYGGVESEQRIDVAQRFQRPDGPKLLVANPAAAGVGFTLTAATYAIYETLTWRYDLYAQSQDRNHRIGQSNPVIYLRLIADDTIEEAVVESLARKAVLASDLVGDEPMERLITEMGPEGFRELLISGRLPGGP